MTIATFGVLMFLVGVLLLLVLPEHMVNLKVLVAWITIMLFCIGGWILSLLFLIVAAAFAILINL